MDRGADQIRAIVSLQQKAAIDGENVVTMICVRLYYENVYFVLVCTNVTTILSLYKCDSNLELGLW